MKIYTFDPQKNRLILAGYCKENVFWKKVNKKRFMIKYRAYGIQEDVINNLLNEDIEFIHIKTHTNKVLKSSLCDWIKFSIKENYGHGKQYFLSINYMK